MWPGDWGEQTLTFFLHLLTLLGLAQGSNANLTVVMIYRIMTTAPYEDEDRVLYS